MLTVGKVYDWIGAWVQTAAAAHAAEEEELAAAALELQARQQAAALTLQRARGDKAVSSIQFYG